MSTMSFFMDDAIPSRPRTADGGIQRPTLIKRPTLGSRNVTFDSNIGPFPAPPRPDHRRLNSDYSVPEYQLSRGRGEAQVQRIDRHVQNIDPDLEPALPFTDKFQNAPFLIYDDSFADLLGQNPALENIVSDSRGPFFYGGGAYVSRISTCFLTSNLLHDSDPGAVSSGNRRVEITKLEYRDANKVARDKDPTHGYERGFRPKPKLPRGHIYRFHPASGDCRVVASDVKRPVGLAFSPDYNTLYVSERIKGHDGVYVFAYDAKYSPSSQPPTFDISVVPGVKHTANGSFKLAPGSSSQSFSHHYRSHPYATPDSSPKFLAATPVRTSSSRSPSGSRLRTQDSHQRLLASTMNGPRSPLGDPTSAPASMRPPPLLTSVFPNPTSKQGTYLANKRLVIYTPSPIISGAISTDPIHGYLWLGTEEGVQVWNADIGELIGKILVEQWNSNGMTSHQSKMRGVSKVVFTSDGEALLLGGERIWQLKMDLHGTHATSDSPC
ncbi:ATPase [Cladophialophora chaetospira]|uniref:ATPase n=1 Tax=Cladophialophora chaetospira TaxID=386627 RepID=A0AA38XL96_9EURO|nr:ATPase [Cladophialophora chaetospira]